MIYSRKLRFRKGSWLILPAVVLGLFISPAKAEAQPGLSATVYNNYWYNGSPPLPTVSGRPIQCTTTYLSINQNFGNNICGLYDDFIVKYEGYITSPTTETYTLYMHGDDGVKLYLDDVLTIDAWYDSGNAGATAQVSFVAGVPQKLLAWYYENGGGNWVRLDYLLDGSWTPVPNSWFTQTNEPTNSTTTTTTLAPYLNEVTNLTAVADGNGSVNLGWDMPTSSNVDIYAYGVMFYDLDEIGGTTSGGWGVWTNQGTNYSLADYMFSGTTGFGPVRFGIKAGNQSCFDPEGVGPCIYGPETNVDVIVIDPTPPTTTTTSTTTTSTTTTTTVVPTTMLQTTTTELPSTTTSSTTQTPVVTQPDVPLTTVATATTLSSTTTSRPQQTTTLPSTTTFSTTTSTTIVNTTTTLDTPETANVLATSILANSDNPAELSAAVDNAVASVESPEELASIVTSLLDKPLTDEQFSAVIAAVFTESLTTEELSAALDAVFAEPISDEKFAEVLSAVLDNPLNAEQFAAVVDILESDSVSEEQVSLAVDNILENGITESQATDLATSPKVLESIDPEQASAVFEQIPVSDLTTEEEKALVEAVSNAPTEVKNVFENTIDIFGSGLDEYEAVGSNVNVGTRRVVIAAIGAVTSITFAAPSAPTSPIGSGGGSGSPSGGSNPGTSGSGSESQNRRRKPMGGR